MISASPHEGLETYGHDSPAVLVVSRIREDLGWLADVPSDFEVVIYNKGGECPLPDSRPRQIRIIGRKERAGEADSYLAFLRDNVRISSPWVIFCKGDPFVNSPDFIGLLGSRDKWLDVQPLSFRPSLSSPSEDLLQYDSGEDIGTYRIHTEICSLHTLEPVRFFDQRACEAAGRYRKLYNLNANEGIVPHFFRSCRSPEFQAASQQSEFASFAYGSAFAVRARLVESFDEDLVEELLLLSLEPFADYLFERLWLHLFGLRFGSLELAGSSGHRD